MPAIPLSQFPPDFRPRCHKCSSSNLNFTFTRHLWIWNQSEIKYNCCMCGIVGYGDSVVIARFTDQLEAWQKEKLAKEEERIFAEASLKEQAEMQRLAAEQELLKAREAAMKHMTKLERRRAIDNAYRVKKREAAKAAAATIVLTPEQQAEHETKRAIFLDKKRADDRAYKARIRAAEKALAAEKERKEAEVAASTVQAAAEAKAKMKCAWTNCDNPHTETSKYCSRTCSNKSAYLSSRQRKAASQDQS